MDLMFVSGTAVGGSGRSQRELAKRLVGRGHEVTIIVDDERPHRIARFVYEQLSDVSARLGPRTAAAPLRWLESRPGRSVRKEVVDGVKHLWSPVPENAARAWIDRLAPDVVVGNSVLRLTWRKVRVMCEQRRVATVLYVREVAAMNHFTVGAQPADRIVANATSLADGVATAGYDCSMLPSVIDLSLTRTESSRVAALVVNPIASHGIALIWDVARALPERRFVLQESWPLDEGAAAEITERCSRLANVEFRRVALPGPALYGDARVLLVPHQIDNRPRVVAEAQANGIPVIGSDFPGIVEAIGEGGVLLGPADVGGWVDAVEHMWSDRTHYEAMTKRAATHGQRPEIDPDRVVDMFESLLGEAVNAAARRYSMR